MPSTMSYDSTLESASSAMTTSVQPSVFVGRQQIYDGDLNVIAYELLFRSSMENRATIVDGDVATSQLLINSVVEIGLENLTFRLPAFVNFPKNFILGNHEIPFGPELLVVEGVGNGDFG